MAKLTTKRELASKYGVSYPTMIKWLKGIPELKISNERRLLTPKEIQIIYSVLGEPD